MANVTNLINTTWVVNDTNCDAGYGNFNISGYVNNDTSKTFDWLWIGRRWHRLEGESVTSANYIMTYPLTEYTQSGSYWYTPVGTILTFTGGNDIASTRLVSWVNEHCTLQSGGTTTASIIKGNPVENATTYNLYEKVTTGETVEYVFKATNTEINFDLTTLNLSEGAHTFVVQATAQGYESSDYSNEVTYTAGGGS